MEDIQYQYNFHKTILDQLNYGIYFVDTERRITYWNKAAENISGYKAEEVMGKCCSENILMHVNECGTNMCKSACPLMRSICDGIPRDEYIYMHHKEGHRVSVQTHVEPIRNEKGVIMGAIETFNELKTRSNEALQRIEELRKMAYLDHLTGLANRRYMESNLISKLNELHDFGWKFGIIFMDVDHFKEINDVYGHETGDKALVMISKSLSAATRSIDILGRWGGDEFIAILPNVNNEIIREVANRFRGIVYGSALTHKDKKIKVTLSLGVVVALPADSQETLLTKADKLLYMSKSKGGNSISFE